MDAAKTRYDAWGEDLAEETRWRLYRLTQAAREGDGERVRLRSYEDAREYIVDSLHLAPPSRAGWYRFLARRRKELNLRQICRVSGSCESAAEMAAEAKIDFELAARAMRAKAIDATMEDDVDAAKVFANAATAFAAEARKAEELKLAREKFEAAEKRLAAVQDAVKAAKSKGGITAETLQKIEEAAGLL